MTNLWQELDLSLEEEWECSGDSARYKKRVENEWVLEFLASLNRELDDARGRVLSWRPLPLTREAFAEVRREENRRKIMMNGSSEGKVESSVMMSRGTEFEVWRRDGKPVNRLAINEPNGSIANGPERWAGKTSNGPGKSTGILGPTRYNSGPRLNGLCSKGPKQQRRRPWCKHCRKPGNKEDTYWDKHGKPTDWKPSQNSRNRSYQAQVDPTEHSKEHNFTSGEAFNSKQLKQLYQIFSNLQALSQSSTHDPSSSLAHEGNHLRASTISSKYKVPWIINSGASDHMMDS